MHIFLDSVEVLVLLEVLAGLALAPRLVLAALVSEEEFEHLRRAPERHGQQPNRDEESGAPDRGLHCTEERLLHHVVAPEDPSDALIIIFMNMNLVGYPA